MSILRLFLAILCATVSAVLIASAQNNWPTPGGAQAPGQVNMCVNSAGDAVPCPGVTPITGNSTGTTGAVTGTLAAASGVTTYICGFEVDAIGGTAAVGPVTLAGIVGSSMIFQGSSSTAGGAIAKQNFSPCLPASAADTAITVKTTADGTATAVDVNAWGYQQ